MHVVTETIVTLRVAAIAIIVGTATANNTEKAVHLVVTVGLADIVVIVPINVGNAPLVVKITVGVVDMVLSVVSAIAVVRAAQGMHMITIAIVKTPAARARIHSTVMDSLAMTDLAATYLARLSAAVVPTSDPTLVVVKAWFSRQLLRWQVVGKGIFRCQLKKRVFKKTNRFKTPILDQPRVKAAGQGHAGDSQGGKKDIRKRKTAFRP
jgi:hypothetical protein